MSSLVLDSAFTGSFAGSFEGSSDAGPGVPRLLDALLAEQRSLSAVETFARRHEVGALPPAVRIYQERVALGRAPLPGQQLAFRVDLDACTGCKACVTACHSLNGLAEGETWREVGLLVGEGDGSGAQQSVTTACHHCEDPACLAGCPVQAYEKDPLTGIVRHLDDQCIGCQYCVLTCLYDVPKYNADLGIVRKCDMCAGRLAAGEAPACVQGCPNGAISIEIVDHVGDAPAPELLPGAGDSIPDSVHTRPSTRYVSRRPRRPLTPANLFDVRPARAHDSLAVMLVLVQTSVGVLFFDVVFFDVVLFDVVLFDGLMSGASGTSGHPLALSIAFVSAALGLGAATLHLGRPLYAFRAFLGWRTSWMSREIVLLGAYVPLVGLAAGASALAHCESLRPVAWLPALRLVALGFGLAGTACSMMIYVDTHRPLWALRRTAPAFLGTLVGLGALTLAGVTLALAGGESEDARRVVGFVLIVGLVTLVAKGVGERRLLGGAEDSTSVALARTASLLRGPLRGRVRLRLGLALGGMVFGVAACALCLVGESISAGVFAGVFACVFAWGALLAFALGETVERHLFFTAEASPGMPGH